MFTDAKFMDADEKARVFTAWKRFINGGCKYTQFSKGLYNHLIQHCSFIAHYNRAGFYQTYFNDQLERQKFFSQFDRDTGCQSVEYGWGVWLTDKDYSDINNAMVDYYMEKK